MTPHKSLDQIFAGRDAVATKAEMSPGYLSELERGMSAVSTEKLTAISAALEVSVSLLLEAKSERVDKEDDVRFPRALSEAAEQLGLSYRATRMLLQGKLSLVAKRSRNSEHNWDLKDWIKFYLTVKEYLPDD